MARLAWCEGVIFRKSQLEEKEIKTSVLLEHLQASKFYDEDQFFLVHSVNYGRELLEQIGAGLQQFGLAKNVDFCLTEVDFPTWFRLFGFEVNKSSEERRIGVQVSFQHGLVIRKPRLIEVGVSRQAVLDVFGGAGPLDEDDDLMSFGPLGDETVLEEKCQALMSLGMDYGFDQVDLNAEFPDWITFRAILEDDPDLETR